MRMPRPPAISQNASGQTFPSRQEIEESYPHEQTPNDTNTGGLRDKPVVRLAAGQVSVGAWSFPLPNACKQTNYLQAPSESHSCKTDQNRPNKQPGEQQPLEEKETQTILHIQTSRIQGIYCSLDTNAVWYQKRAFCSKEIKNTMEGKFNERNGMKS